MKNQFGPESDHENAHHIARKRKTESVRASQKSKNPRDMQNLVEEMDTEEYGYDPAEYAKYIK